MKEFYNFINTGYQRPLLVVAGILLYLLVAYLMVLLSKKAFNTEIKKFSFFMLYVWTFVRQYFVHPLTYILIMVFVVSLTPIILLIDTFTGTLRKDAKRKK